MVLTPLSELSPIDPTTGNQFNPVDSVEPRQRLGISVEDVRAFRSFVLEQFDIRPEDDSTVAREAVRTVLPDFLNKLVSTVHPLALGNVDRVHRQIKQLAKELLALHPVANRRDDEAVDTLATKFWSHLHMINRHEAQRILSAEHVVFASDDLSSALDELLRAYEDTFNLRHALYLSGLLADRPFKSVRFIGGVLESTAWGYVFETNALLRQSSVVPPNVQIQLPVGQDLPLISGLPRRFQVEIASQGWVHNKEPKGFDR
jgi:hypothetical protein